MKPQAVLDGLLRRLDDGDDGATLFGADWADDWPTGLLDELLAGGLLQPAEPAKFVRCPDCHDDHVEEVEYVRYADGVRAFVRCPDLGRALVDPEMLLRWRVDGAGLASAVRDSLGLGGRLMEAVQGRVWQLGSGPFGGAAPTVFFVRGLGWPEGAEVPEGRGLRLVLTVGDAPSTAFPDDMIVAGLPDLASWSDGALSVDRAALEARVRSVGVPPSPSSSPYTFRREGAHWRMTFEGKEAPLLVHRAGFETIAELLARPHVPIPARTLMLPTAMRGGAQRSTPEDELRSDDLGVDVVDEPTLAQVRARLAAVEGDLLLATDGGPSYKRLQEDRRQIRSYLRQVSNHRGKSRQIVDGRERARLAVGKRIRSAIETIGPELPALAAHLRQAIQPGYEPVYQPTAQIDWVLR